MSRVSVGIRVVVFVDLDSGETPGAGWAVLDGSILDTTLQEIVPGGNYQLPNALDCVPIGADSTKAAGNLGTLVNDFTGAPGVNTKVGTNFKKFTVNETPNHQHIVQGAGQVSVAGAPPSSAVPGSACSASAVTTLTQARRISDGTPIFNGTVFDRRPRAYAAVPCMKVKRGRVALPLRSLMWYYAEASNEALPDNWSYADGTVLGAGTHDISAGAYTKPNLLNRMFIGADPTKANLAAPGGANGNAPGPKWVGGITERMLDGTEFDGHTHTVTYATTIGTYGGETGSSNYVYTFASSGNVSGYPGGGQTAIDLRPRSFGLVPIVRVKTEGIEIPLKAIFMVHMDSANESIPDDCVICTGQTLSAAQQDIVAGNLVVPDLRNYHIVGADRTKAVGAIGTQAGTDAQAPGPSGVFGANGKIMAIGEMPNHYHDGAPYYNPLDDPYHQVQAAMWDYTGPANSSATGGGQSFDNRPYAHGFVFVMKVRR